MKKSLPIFLGIALALSSHAAEITESEASAAVQAWMAEGSTLGRKHRSVASCETISTPSGARLHVVRLAGGGFAVTPTDDRIDPIIAFVPSGDSLVQSSANPLWALLSRDIEARERAAGASSEAKPAKRALLGASAAGGKTSRAQERWAALLGRPSPSSTGRRTLRATQPQVGPQDIRVDSFVESRWSQGTHNNKKIGEVGNKNCYNRFTPKNYPCGCVATAAAQVMRYWKWPTAKVTAMSYNCQVDGKSATYKMQGGVYDWDNMPLDPRKNGATEDECKAIGKLTFDIGVSIGTRWNHDDSVANMYALVPRLTTLFGYANAVAADYTSDYPYSLDELKKVVIPNCNARTPAIMSISGKGGHAVVVDGYGYADSDEFFIHVNCGWAGEDDGWYLPPNITGDFNTIEGLVFNIFPQSRGSILSGRVFDKIGTPIEGATVELRLVTGTSVVATSTTDGRGIYAFVAEAGEYIVTATSDDASQSITVTLGQTTGISLNDDGKILNNSAASIGNSYGNDITIVGVAGIPPLDISPEPDQFYPPQEVEIKCSDPELDVTIHYTLDGTEPTDSSPIYNGPLTIEDDVTIKARAWKPGLNPSAVASKTYTCDISGTTLLRGDKTNFPFVIYGAGGEKTVADAFIYTKDDGEINHADYYWQEHTIWYKWKAPGTGTMRFAVTHGYFDSTNKLHAEYSSLAVYPAASVSSAARLDCASTLSDTPPYYNKAFLPDFIPWVDVPVVQDEEYLVVAVSCRPEKPEDAENAPVFLTLSWSGDIAYEAPFVVVDENGDPHGYKSIDDAIDSALTTYAGHQYIQVNQDAEFLPPNGVRFRAKNGVTLTPLPLSSEYEDSVEVPCESTAQGVVTYESGIRPTKYTWTGSRNFRWNTAGNWTYEESGTTATATRHPQAGDTVVFKNGAYVTITDSAEVDKVEVDFSNKDESMTLKFNSLGNTSASVAHAALTCPSFEFPTGTIFVAFGGSTSVLPDEAELISWSNAPAGSFAFEATQEGFELAPSESGLAIVAKDEPMETQRAVIGDHTWTFAVVDGKTAIIYNNGNAAVEPAEGHIDIPDKLGTYVVSEIGSRAFAGCNLTSVKIPDGVKLIDHYAFANCTALKCADIGKGISDSGNGAVNIKMGAFAGCSALKAIVFRGAAAPAISADNILAGTPTPPNCKVYVQKSAKRWPMNGSWLGKPVVFGDYMVEVRARAKPDAEVGCKSLSGTGSYALGKKATLKATPASNYVFAGWYDDPADERPLSRAASYAYVVTGEDVEFLADFVRIDVDADSLDTDLDGESFRTAGDGTFEMPVDERVSSYSEFKATFKNLPTGLKYDAKTYKIAGKATKPDVYEIVMGLTNASVKKAREYKFTISVPNFKWDEESVGVALEDRYRLQAGIAPSLSDEVSAAAANGWKLSVSGLPSGVKFDANKGLFSGVASKEGFYTVYFTATKGKEKQVATATFEVVFPEVRLEVAAWDDASATNSAKVSGGGKYPFGKKVTLKATAAKGNVFMGWYDGEALLSQAASYSLVMPETDMALTAMFVTAAEDKASIQLAVDGVEMDAAVSSKPPYRTNVWAGVYLEWPVAAEALSATTVKVAGLPSGLKFAAKPVTSKVGSGKTAVVVTNVPANTIYGAPTAASKTDKYGNVTPSAVKVTVTTAGKSSQIYQIDTVVEALPSWAQGSFAGEVGNWERGMGNGGSASAEASAAALALADKSADMQGTVSLTVSAAGKVSGKMQAEGLSYTLAAPYYSGFKTVPWGEGLASNFLADVTASWSYKEGSKTIKTNDVVRMAVQDNDGIGGFIETALPNWRAWQYNWKVEPWKALGTSLNNQTRTYAIRPDGSPSEDKAYIDAELGETVAGRMTLKFSANGSVSVAGEFVSGYDENKKRYTTVKASGSATLVPVDDETGVVFVYLTPKGRPPYACSLAVRWSDMTGS